MADCDVTRQFPEIESPEHLASKPQILANLHMSAQIRGNPGTFLPPVLKSIQPVIHQMRRIPALIVAIYTNHSAFLVNFVRHCLCVRIFRDRLPRLRPCPCGICLCRVSHSSSRPKNGTCQEKSHQIGLFHRQANAPPQS